MQNQEHITPVDQFVIDYIKKLRLEKDLTQQDIADIIGISRGFVSDIESENSRAKYNIRHINALADYFGISPKDFLPMKAFPVDSSDKGDKKPVKKRSASKKKVIKKKGKR